MVQKKTFNILHLNLCGNKVFHKMKDKEFYLNILKNFKIYDILF